MFHRLVIDPLDGPLDPEEYDGGWWDGACPHTDITDQVCDVCEADVDD